MRRRLLRIVVGPGRITVAGVRTVAREIAAALRSEGDVEAAARLDEACATVGQAEPEQLLALRSALVSTRPRWSLLDGDLPARAAAALSRAKRLAIEL